VLMKMHGIGFSKDSFDGYWTIFASDSNLFKSTMHLLS
jgi:hypothetical protein